MCLGHKPDLANVFVDSVDGEGAGAQRAYGVRLLEVRVVDRRLLVARPRD